MHEAANEPKFTTGNRVSVDVVWVTISLPLLTIYPINSMCQFIEIGVIVY